MLFFVSFFDAVMTNTRPLTYETTLQMLFRQQAELG